MPLEKLPLAPGEPPRAPGYVATPPAILDMTGGNSKKSRSKRMCLLKLGRAQGSRPNLHSYRLTIPFHQRNEGSATPSTALQHYEEDRGGQTLFRACFFPGNRALENNVTVKRTLTTTRHRAGFKSGIDRRAARIPRTPANHVERNCRSAIREKWLRQSRTIVV